MEQILVIKDLGKQYPGTATPALKNASFAVERGELIGVIGPSGAGKSTLLRCINRLIEPDSGTVEVEGTDFTALRGGRVREMRRRIGMMFQHYNLVSRLTVMQNVMHGRLGYMSTLGGVMGSYTEEDKHKAIALLEKTGLQPYMYKRVADLSGGQKQRVGIVRALMQDPAILLCDEPIASLDPASARVVMDLIRGLVKESGITCLVNLHQVDVAMEYADRIIGMRAGEILFGGTPGELDEAAIEEIYDTPMDQLMLKGAFSHAS